MQNPVDQEKQSKSSSLLENPIELAGMNVPFSMFPHSACLTHGIPLMKVPIDQEYASWKKDELLRFEKKCCWGKLQRMCAKSDEHGKHTKRENLELCSGSRENMALECSGYGSLFSQMATIFQKNMFILDLRFLWSSAFLIIAPNNPCCTKST